jgi:uncharacterized protein (DUF305 family)
METKSLLIGISSFIAGGLLVSIAAVTFDKNDPALQAGRNTGSMSQMVDSLKGKTGDGFDEQFIASMIEHHQGAVDMARLAGAQAKHQEVKDLSKDIISAQEKELTRMKLWQMQWGYDGTGSMNMSH